MQIRKAKISDIPALLEMMIRFNKEESIELPVAVMESTIELSFSYPDHIQTFLVVASERVCGYIHVCFSFSFEYQGVEASIDEIFIANEFRGQGLAKAVINDIENIVSSSGAVVLRADVADDKPWLPGFYQKLGFERSTYRPFYKRL